jgi:hypothetical protein
MLTTPPNIPSFDMANKVHSLHSSRKALPPPAPAPTPNVDVNSLMSVLLLQMITKSSLLQSTSPPVEPDADLKRKRSSTSSSSGTLNCGSLEQPVKKKIAYKKQYHDGGKSHISGPPMVDGDPDPFADYDLYYKCDTQNQWLPVPKGFVVIEDADEEEDTSFVH